VGTKVPLVLHGHVCFFGISTLGVGLIDVTTPFFEGTALGMLGFCFASVSLCMAFRFKFDLISLEALVSFCGPILCVFLLIYGAQYLREHPDSPLFRILSHK
jgi:hypothetical protein